MSTRPTAPPPAPVPAPARCRHPEHNPPALPKLRPGLYTHACPACGRTLALRVTGASWRVS